MGAMSASIVLLCEDLQTDSFVRRFLGQRNFGYHDIQTLPLPGSRQSGEQSVRERYPRQLKAIRDRQRAVLVVVIDADTNTTAFRRSKLDQECDKEDVPRRGSNDRVIVVVPRRNIETWLYYLKHNTSVDETRRYQRLNRESDCHPLADELHRICHERQQLDPSAPQSLKEACIERGVPGVSQAHPFPPLMDP
jgi:hypothetical protein